MMTEQKNLDAAAVPDTTVDVAKVFGIETKMKVPAFKTANEYVPDHDSAYRFDRETTLAILAGFLIFAAVLTTMMGTYMDYFVGVMHQLIPPR